jgi:purine-cytosine permease-like protein
MAMKQFKELNYGYMAYGQGLGIGTLVSAVFGLLSGIAVWLYTSFVDTEYMSRMMDKQRDAMLDQGLSDEQIDAGMAMAENFQGPLTLILGSLIGAVVIGFILSLIISAIMKNNRPEFE